MTMTMAQVIVASEEEKSEMLAEDVTPRDGTQFPRMPLTLFGLQRQGVL